MLHIETFTFNPFQENTYVLSNEEEEAIIVDPGTYFPAEAKSLKDYIFRAGLQPKLLINTHCHLDHVFGNQWVSECYNLELLIHPKEEEILAHARKSGEKYGLPFEDYIGKINFINEGENLQLAEDKLVTILVPGHSPGSICLYCQVQNFIIGGDVLFRESIGRTDLYKGNHEELLQSIKEKLLILPDETIVYPGHGPKTTIGYEKQNNPFLER
jgi:glyoxylase-like metal-dependent hydrolase (beta-lactamase superfamily II)